MSLDLEKLRTANVLRDKEWNTGNEKATLSFRGLEIAGEAGEACNVVKKLERERMGIKGSTATLKDLADELADVIIAVDLLAMDMNIDMSKAIVSKFNSTSNKYCLDTQLRE